MKQEIEQIDLQKLFEIRAQTINEIEEAWKNHDRIACVRYPGFGKSYYIVKMLVEKYIDKKFLILVHRRALRESYKENLYGYKNVHIDTYQKLMNNGHNEEDYNRYDYIICDECHHLIDNSWSAIVNQLINYNNCKVLGITANEVNGNNKSIEDTFYFITSNIDLGWAIDNKIVIKPKYVSAVVDIDDKYIQSLNLSDQQKQEYYKIDRYEIKKLINVPKILKKYITKNILDTNVKIICFVPRISDYTDSKKSLNKWFKQAFPEKTINIYSVSSYEDSEENDFQLNNFRKSRDNKNIDIILTVNMLNEGIHIPEISTCIFLRYTKSPVVYLQQIGRALNNKEPLIFDLVSNYNRLDFYRSDKVDRNRNHNYYDWVIDARQFLSENCLLIDETKDISNILRNYRFQYSKRSIYISAEQLNYLHSNGKNMTFEEIVSYLSCEENPIDYLKRTLRPFLNRNNISYKHKKQNHLYDVDKIQYLKDNSKNMTMHQISDYLGVPNSTAIHLCERYNLLWIKKQTYTTKDQLEFLKHNSKNMTPEEVAKYLNKSVVQAVAIMQSRKLPYIKKKKASRYNPDKIAYLRNNAKNMTSDEISNYMGFSDRNCVYTFLRRMNIEYNKRSSGLRIGNYKYDQKIIKFLQEHPDQFTIDDIRKMINYEYSEQSLRSYCAKNKIKVKRKEE